MRWRDVPGRLRLACREDSVENLVAGDAVIECSVISVRSASLRG